MDILLFGITREIVGSAVLTIPSGADLRDVNDLRAWLQEQFPQFKGLSSLAIAINREYANDTDLLPPGAEVALIPPVSGG
jgi:molybdopterin converting factor subunit 1